MKTINNDQIDRLLEDISSIKAVINRNKPILQQVFNSGRFRLFAFLCALSYIGFSMLIFFLMRYYGSFGSIPDTTRYIIYAAIAADFVFLQILKRRGFLVSAKEIDQSLTFGWLIKELYSYPIVHLYVPLTALMFFLSIYFIVNDIPYFIIPTVSIFFGLQSNFMGTILEIRQGLIVGYWFLVTGVCTIIFSSIPAPIALSMTLGCGMLILFILGCLSSGSTEGD